MWCASRSFPIRTLVTISALLILGVGAPGAARAQNTPGTPANFEIDGNLKAGNGAPAGEDWFPNSPTPGVIDGVTCGPNPSRLPVLFSRDLNWATPMDSTLFKGTSNKNNDNIASGAAPWSWAPGNGGPQKNDITEVYAHSRMDGNGDIWLIMGAATRSSNGDEHIDFEINQAGLRIEGGPAGGFIVGNGTANGRTIGDRLISV